MNKEEALKLMESNRLGHSLLNSWYTKCHNGKYYNNKGEEFTEEEMKEILKSIPDYSNSWYVIPGPRERTCG